MEQFLQAYDTFQDAHPTYQGFFVAVLSKGNIVIEDVKHMNKFENTQEVHACILHNTGDVIYVIVVLFVTKLIITLLPCGKNISIIIIHDLEKSLLIGCNILRFFFFKKNLHINCM